jgi:hypothetical protein
MKVKRLLRIYRCVSAHIYEIREEIALSLQVERRPNPESLDSSSAFQIYG